MHVIHDSWALLQEMASEVCTIIIVNINVGLFSMVTELWVLFTVVNVLLRNARLKSHYATLKRLEKEQSDEAATRNSRCLQPSCSVSCGRRWHFLKTASSTDQC